MAYGLRFFAIRGKITEFFAQDPTGRFMLLASDVIVKFVVDRVSGKPAKSDVVRIASPARIIFRD